MSFTSGRWESGSPHTDGQRYIIGTWGQALSGTATPTRVAAGDYALAISASDTSVLVFSFDEILRTGEPHLEKTSSNTAGYEQYNQPSGPPYTVPGPPPGLNPTTSTSYNPINPASVLKGVQFTGIDLIYSITTAALTTNTVGLYAKQDTNGAAPTITTLIAQAANGLATAASANRYVTSVAVPAAQQNFIVTPDTAVTVEWDVTTSTGTADIFGVVFKFNFNYD